MDRYRFRNILRVLLFSCDLVVTQESIYESLGSPVKLVCPIIKTNRAITWLGPPNLKVYAAGTDVSNEFSSQVKINITDEKSILLVHRFTKDKSGKFRCSDIYNNVKIEFNLIIKKNPSDLIIGNATGDKITAVEGREQQLECRVTSGEPGGNITWSTDGAVVAENGPSLVTYRLTPKRSDNGQLFKCAAFNSDGEKILESSVLLKVFYISKISFIPRQTLTVKEGVEAQLICINDGNDPEATTVWKRQHTNTNITQNDQLIFKSINRTDAGLYICRVYTKAGVFENGAKVVVQYAPTIDIRYSPNERKMKCIPNGMPDRYLFKDWEHTTEYNDHLRFLPITKGENTAILTFPTKVIGKDQFRDRGTYICRASNNISSIDGMFVMRKYSLNFNSIPHFVSSTENIQFGAYLKTAEIKIKFVSVPEYTSYDLYKNGCKFTDYTESVYRNIKLTDYIYGKNVSVKGSVISLQIQIDTLDDFNLYKVVVKNTEGSSHHTINLVSANEYAIAETFHSVHIVVILSLVIIIAVLLVAGMGLYVHRLKQRYRQRMEPALNVETPEGTYDEIAHYTEISTIDNVQPTSQENDDSILPMINRDVDVMSSEHTSTSSDNDIVSSEYLDDGYEQPHTTLVVTNQVKDEHVYLNTKKESNYENTIPFENIACGPACDYLDDSLSDKRNALDDHEYLNLNNDVNDFNVKNERVTQCFINPRMNEAEYINLSLNQ